MFFNLKISLEALGCVLEQDTLSSAVLVQPQTLYYRICGRLIKSDEMGFLHIHFHFTKYPYSSQILFSLTYIIRLLCWCAAVPAHEAYIARTAHSVLCTHFGFKKGIWDYFFSSAISS